MKVCEGTKELGIERIFKRYYMIVMSSCIVNMKHGVLLEWDCLCELEIVVLKK